MLQQLHFYLLLVSLALTLADEDLLKLPLCPGQLTYFPQSLPMHCRMPRSADLSEDEDGLPSFRRPGGQPPPISLPMSFGNGPPGMPPDIKDSVLRGLPGPMADMPPGFPGMPPGFPGMPPGMPGMPLDVQSLGLRGSPGSSRRRMGGMPLGMPEMPPPMPPPPGLPGPMPMPMQMPMPMPPHKLPVIVMPFYSPDRRSYTKAPRRRPHKHPRTDSDDTDCSEETDTSSTDDDSTDGNDPGWWKRPGKNKKGHKKYGIFRRSNRHGNIKKKKRKRKGELLTPILQYVTKDGYVIFEKKISKNEAKNWLGPKEDAKAKAELDFKKDLEVTKAQEIKPELEVEDIEKEESPTMKEKEEKDMELNESNELTEPPAEKQNNKHRQRAKLKPGRLL